MIRRFWKDERGQGLAELVLTLPVLIALIMGSISLILAYQGKAVVTNAARNAGRYIAIECGKGNPNWYDGAVSLVQQDLRSGALAVEDFAPLGGNAEPGQWYVTASCTGSGGVAQVQVEYAQTNLFPPLRWFLTREDGGSRYFPLRVGMVFPVE